jgi:hypothetical protein
MSPQSLEIHLRMAMYDNTMPFPVEQQYTSAQFYLGQNDYTQECSEYDAPLVSPMIQQTDFRYGNGVFVSDAINQLDLPIYPSPTQSQDLSAATPYHGYPSPIGETCSPATHNTPWPNSNCSVNSGFVSQGTQSLYLWSDPNTIVPSNAVELDQLDESSTEQAMERMEWPQTLSNSFFTLAESSQIDLCDSMMDTKNDISDELSDYHSPDNGLTSPPLTSCSEGSMDDIFHNEEMNSVKVEDSSDEDKDPSYGESKPQKQAQRSNNDNPAPTGTARTPRNSNRMIKPRNTKQRPKQENAPKITIKKAAKSGLVKLSIIFYSISI